MGLFCIHDILFTTQIYFPSIIRKLPGAMQSHSVSKIEKLFALKDAIQPLSSKFANDLFLR